MLAAYTELNLIGIYRLFTSLVMWTSQIHFESVHLRLFLAILSAVVSFEVLGVGEERNAAHSTQNTTPEDYHVVDTEPLELIKEDPTKNYLANHGSRFIYGQYGHRRACLKA